MRKHTLHKLLLLLVGLSSVGLFFMAPKPALAANPSTISFQGKVVNANGTNQTSCTSTCSIVFRIYNTASPTMTSSCTSTSTCVWEETQGSVSVTNGIFQVELGSACALTTTCNNSAFVTANGGPLNFANNSSLYLTLQFNGDTSGSNGGFMFPLIHLNSVPFALNADNSSNLGGISAANYVQLATGNLQADTTANNSIAVNKTGVSGDILLLEANSKKALEVNNSGTLLLGQAGASGLNGTLTFNNSAGSNTVSFSLQANPGSSYNLLLPTTGPAVSQCLQTDASVATQLTFAACSAGGGTALSINGSSVGSTANFVDTTATTTVAGVAYTNASGTISTSLSNADGTHAGALSASTQTIGGDKSFTGTSLFSNPVAVQATSAIALQIQNASGTKIISADTTINTLNISNIGPVFAGGTDISGSSSGTGSKAGGEVVTSGHYAFMTSPANATTCSSSPGSAIGCELQVYDISSPTSPVYVGGADSTGTTNGGTGSTLSYFSPQVKGQYLYVLATTSGTTCTNSPGSSTGCELQVYDISTPASPTYVGGGDTSGNTNTGTGSAVNYSHSFILNGFLYIDTNAASAVACSSAVGSAAGCELQVWSLSSPTAPAYVGGADITGATNSGTGNSPFPDQQITGAGNNVYVGTFGGTSSACSGTVSTNAEFCEIQVYNVTTPSTPTYVAGINSSGEVNTGNTGTGPYFSLLVSNNKLYAAQSANSATCSQTAGSAAGCELQVYDVTTPSSPSYIGGADSSGTTNGGSGSTGSYSGMVISGNYLYTTGDGTATTCSATVGSAAGCELKVYNISTPSAPAYVGGTDSSGSPAGGTSSTSLGFASLYGGRYIYTNLPASGTACSQTLGSAFGCELQVFDIAGSGLSTGGLNVRDGGTFQGSFTASSTALFQGTALFQNISNSTTAFQVQNSTSVALITVDTTNKIVQIGSATTDANAVVLILDSYNNATDPAGGAFNGAMYYNSSTSTFRCYQGSAWRNCLGGGPSNQSTSTPVALTAGTDTYLAGSLIPLPAGGFRSPTGSAQDGSKITWRVTLSKTAAGTTASTLTIRVGTNGTTGDTARCTAFNGGTPTTAIDGATIYVTVYATAGGSGATLNCSVTLTHQSPSAGFASVPIVAGYSTQASFDSTPAGTKIGLSYNAGTGSVITVQSVDATTINL